MIRRCTESDFKSIFEIINDSAIAYKSVIPEDRWHDPYMPAKEVRREIDDGVTFWGFEKDGDLLGIMGIQDKGDVVLIRHAYVRTRSRKQGIGEKLTAGDSHLPYLAIQASLNSFVTGGGDSSSVTYWTEINPSMASRGITLPNISSETPTKLQMIPLYPACQAAL